METNITLNTTGNHTNTANRSLDDILTTFKDYRIHKQLTLYVPPVLLLFGTVGNVLSFCVLMRRAMRVTATYNYLAALAILDTLVLYGDCLFYWLGHITAAGRIANLSVWGCKLITMIGYAVSVSSVWLLIAVTVDRYIATVHEIHAITICTQRRAVRVIGCIIVCVILLHIHFLWTMGLRDSGNGSMVCTYTVKQYKYLVVDVWPWIDGLLYCFAPFVIIATLNTLIVIQVVKSRRNTQQVHLDCNGGEERPAWNTSDNSFRVTIMLVVVSFTFLVCMFPSAVNMINKKDLYSGGEIDHGQLASYILANTICKLLLYTNHSINFYLYLLSGQRFRQEMCAMMRGFSRRGRYQSTPTLHYSTRGDVTPNMVSLRQYSTRTNNNTTAL